MATSDHVTIEDLEDLGVTKVILNNGEVHQQAFLGDDYVMLESPTGRHRIPLTEVHHFSRLAGKAMLRGHHVNLEELVQDKVACNSVGDIFTTEEEPEGNPRDGYQALVRFEDLTDITSINREYGFNQSLTLNTQPTNDPPADGSPL